MAPTLASSRVAIVSGKGGVGKTTVAAALATAAARAGKRVLVIEVEQRDGLAPLFGAQHIGYEERRLAPGVHGLSVVPDEALVEYLYLFYGIGRFVRPLAKSKAIEFATHTAPGLRDILLIGKVKEAERRRTGGGYTYDLLVLDAPPTGRLPRFLSAPRSVAELVKSGPIRQQAQGVLDMVFDPKRSQVVLVTTPEEMPVRETIEAAQTLTQMGVALGPVVLNGVYPRSFTPAAERALARDATGAIANDARTIGVPLEEEAVSVLGSVASTQARRARNQRSAIRELGAELVQPQVTLPYLFTERFGPREIGPLAAALLAQEAV
jgi:anion-transporting  ArsA/GET3 family ATPase